MKNNKILCLAIISTPLLLACGGSSSSDDKEDAVKASIVGTWESPSCEYGTYYPETGASDYKKTLLEITETSIKSTESTYSDYDCTLETARVEKNVTLTDEGAVTGADTGLEMRKLSTSELPNKWLAYVNPSSTHLILTPGSTEFPNQINLASYYVKQGADFSAKATGSNITVLGHFGLNLKTGLSEESESTNDLSTIQWSPSYEYIEGEEYGGGIWLRDYSDDDNLYVHPTGKTVFAEVTAPPATWFVKSSPDFDGVVDAIPSVKKGEVNVIKLRDGSYAKLKVLNTPDPESYNWSLLVEYQLFN